MSKKYLEVSLPSEYANRNSDQICRTCKHSSNHLWGYTTAEINAHKAAGGDLDELACAPTKEWGAFKVLNQTDWRGRIQPITAASEVPTRAIVSSCGQVTRSECLQCDHFNAVQVPVYFVKNAANDSTNDLSFRAVNKNGTIKWEPYSKSGKQVGTWNVTVGGSCNLVDRCEFTPRKVQVETPSCNNCFYMYHTGDQWQTDEREVNAVAALTPFEQENPHLVGAMHPNARQAAIDDAITDPNKARNLALWRKQTAPYGYRTWVQALLLNTAPTKRGQLYKVKLSSSSKKAIKFTDSNPNIIVQSQVPLYYDHKLSNEDFYVVLEIGYPLTAKYGIDAPTRRYGLIWPQYPAKKLNVKSSSNVYSWRNDNCVDCRKNVTKAEKLAKRDKVAFDISTVEPCYFHAKGLRYDVLLDETTYLNPKGIYVEEEVLPHATMHVTELDGKILAVDGNGNLPVAYSDTKANASVFRLNINQLCNSAKRMFGSKGEAAIRGQYNDIVSQLKHTAPIKNRAGWLRISSQETNKHWCSHPEGLDLRKVWGDSFGLERVDFDFDFGAKNTMDVEEELRVGYRQHEFTPQRLQEEVIAGLVAHPNYDPSTGGIHSGSDKFADIDWHVTKIDGIGGMTDEQGVPVDSVDQFMDRLDEEVIIGYIDESGNMPRFQTRRGQLFGYKLSHGFYGSRTSSTKVSMPVNDPSYIIFNDDSYLDQEQVNYDNLWCCPSCNATYQHEEVDFWYPVCDCGSDLYMDHNVREVFNPRSTSGIGNALVMDNNQIKTSKLLQNTLCDQWRLNAPRRIELKDIQGPSSDKSGFKEILKVTMASVSSKKIREEKVGSPDLTPLQLEHNKRVIEISENVIAKRTKHIDNNPDASLDELVKMYPMPSEQDFFLYVPRAIGSASKMG